MTNIFIMEQLFWGKCKAERWTLSEPNSLQNRQKWEFIHILWTGLFYSICINSTYPVHIQDSWGPHTADNKREEMLQKKIPALSHNGLRDFWLPQLCMHVLLILHRSPSLGEEALCPSDSITLSTLNFPTPELSFISAYHFKWLQIPFMTSGYQKLVPVWSQSVRCHIKFTQICNLFDKKPYSLIKHFTLRIKKSFIMWI